jgi:hypothetical protein
MCWPVGPKTKPEHGLVAIKRAVSDWAKARLNFIYLFFTNFIFLIKNLFNTIKFELKYIISY